MAHFLNKQKKWNHSLCRIYNMCDDEIDASRTECKLQNILKNILGFNVNNLTYGLDIVNIFFGRV